MPQPNDDRKRKPLSKRHFLIGNAPSQPVTKNYIPYPKATIFQTNFSFTYTLREFGIKCNLAITSVRAHLLEHITFYTELTLEGNTKGQAGCQRYPMDALRYSRHE